MKEYQSIEELQRHIRHLSSSISNECLKLRRFNDFSSVASSIILGSRSLDQSGPSRAKMGIMDSSRLGKHFDTYQFMLEKKEELNNILYSLQNSFKGMGLSTDRAIKDVLKLKESVDLAIDQSKEVLHGLATKNAPDKFKSIVEQLSKLLNKKIKSRGMDIHYSIGPTGNKDYQVVGYIHFKHMVGEDQFVYENFYVIVVHTLSTKDYSIACSKSYKLPGSIRGDKVQDGSGLVQSLYNRAIVQMHIEDSIDALEPRRPPIDPNAFKNVQLPYIEKIDIKDNVIRFTCSGKVPEHKAVEEILATLLKMVRKVHPHNTNLVKYKTYKKGSSLVIDFIFTIGDKPLGKLSSIDLNLLKEKYSLTNKQLVDIQRVIEND